VYSSFQIWAAVIVNTFNGFPAALIYRGNEPLSPKRCGGQDCFQRRRTGVLLLQPHVTGQPKPPPLLFSFQKTCPALSGLRELTCLGRQKELIYLPT